MLRKMGDFDVAKGLSIVYNKINDVCAKQNLNYKPRLVAVGKTKPVEMIIACYENGHRHFGENYIQELIEKSTNPETLDKCKDIKWHFIGKLQTNKIAKLLSIPNLDMVETVVSERYAAALNSTWANLKREEPLKIMVQVNTSREDVKGGIEPENCNALVKYVLNQCPSLRFIGLMTIGKYGYDISLGPNPDYLSLTSCRESLCNELELEKDQVELSMGMSDDYEQAIELGSTNVRVGQSIFGCRAKKQPTQA